MFPGRNCVYYSQTVRPDYDERFLNLVHHVLLLNRSPTFQKFCLDFHFSLCHSIRQRVSGRCQSDFLRNEKRMANEIGSWIQFSLNKNLKVLDLSFSAHGTFEPQMDYILSSCPMLEDLTLWFCYGHRRVVLHNSNLKTLVLGVRWFGTRIHVSCPTLLSLYMFGTVEVLDITNVASIVEVSVNCMGKFDFRQDYQEMRIFLQTVTGAKSLKLCSWFALVRAFSLLQLLQVFSSWQLKNLPSPTFSCKSLQLHLDFVKWHLPGILNLLKQCPCLEKLMIEVTSYYESTSRNTLSWIHPYEFDADGRYSCSVLESTPQDGGGSWSCNGETSDSVSGIFARAFHGVRGNDDIRGKADMELWLN
ncbi:hypothetical protein RND71_013061 [Anisodus tanguticus]|uniref:Uncharacterized protein n=1 Tax=Anisodus tanguticus TaxID=243964 RepID=A0AAE1SEH8_9SOLA|nr:hypothetical protein RND71_013061 [Anisodus tanguticus]